MRNGIYFEVHISPAFNARFQAHEIISFVSTRVQSAVKFTVQWNVDMCWPESHFNISNNFVVVAQFSFILILNFCRWRNIAKWKMQKKERKEWTHKSTLYTYELINEVVNWQP